MSSEAHIAISWELVSAVLGFIGAGAWLPFLWEKFMPPRLEGKLVGYGCSDAPATYQRVLNDGGSAKLEGIFYVARLSLTSLRGNFPIARVEVGVSYANDSARYRGTIVNITQLNMNVKKPEGTTDLRSIKIPNSEHVFMLSIIPKDAVVVVFVPFVVEKTPGGMCSSITFKFYDYRRRHKEVTVSINTTDQLAMPSLEDYITPGG